MIPASPSRCRHTARNCAVSYWTGRSGGPALPDAGPVQSRPIVRPHPRQLTATRNCHAPVRADLRERFEKNNASSFGVGRMPAAPLTRCGGDEERRIVAQRGLIERPVDGASVAARTAGRNRVCRIPQPGAGNPKARRSGAGILDRQSA
jgi:hypothetical protein